MYRPEDPPEYNSLYAIPAAVFLGSYGWAALKGCAEVHQAAYLAASLCCVGALGGLSSQKTSRLGNNLGMVKRKAIKKCINLVKFLFRLVFLEELPQL